MARLASERAGLLWQLLDTDRPALSELPIYEGQNWTVKDVLAHIAAWDRWEHNTMVSMLAGQSPNLEAVQDLDAFNLNVTREWHHRPLLDVVAELQEARADWVSWVREVPLEAFFEARWFEGWDWSFPNCLEVQWQHDVEHANEIAAWRKREGLKPTSGPQVLLSAALNAAREELLAAADLVAPGERTSRQVCGAWTLKDVLGHLADWEWEGVEGLRNMIAGQSPRVEHIADIDAWNHAHAQARRDQAWDDVWRDLQLVRGEFLDALGRMDEVRLAESFRFPWGRAGTAYQWTRVYVTHDREHAQDLRGAMGVDTEPKVPVPN
ncbi:MAG: DinB family protein [Anaerolineae bacterium]|jgi:uncharacterized damage-inducible protein DinB